MSGNPFRASLHQKQSPAAPAPSTGFVDSSDSSRAAERELDHDSGTAGQPTPQRTKKSVRIESPTSSTTHPAAYDAAGGLLQRAERAYPASPSTINSPAGFSDNFEDQEPVESLGRGAGGKEDAYETRTTPGSTRRTSPMIEALRSPTGVPANPFSRTLATIEPHEKGSGGQAHISDRPSAEKTGATSAGSKASLDVEGFKRLLMTGISSPSTSGSPPVPQATTAPPSIHPSIFESSSSTDTSSISRQSLFEPIQEPHVETPRTSYEMAASDDETVGLVGSGRREKRKPPPPKPRHGKLVTPRQPQVVSFSDFSASIPDASPISRTRTHSDLNKPLPPPPILSPAIEHIITQDKSQDELLPTEIAADEPSDQPSDLGISLPPQKKVPPPVPLTRRHSQLRTSNASIRSRSNSQLTMSSVQSTETPILSPAIQNEPVPSPAQKAPPPPPPSRRHGAPLAGSNTPSANSSTTELPGTAPSARRLTSSSSNPPSSRRTTFSSPPDSSTTGPNRASSVHSTRNNRAASHESATMPPPPPPPRRRQSGRTSIDTERPHAPANTTPPESRRTSLENKRNSIDSKRRTSVASESSLRHEYAPAPELENALYSPKEEMTEEPLALKEVVHTESNSSNILDDMEKFQREIDELRKRYGPAS